MESRIINHIDKYITFLFGGENHYDREQRIYNKLLRLEGHDLEVWVDTKLKRFINGEMSQEEFDDNQFEGVPGLIFFVSWYYYKFDPDSGDLMSLNEIFGGNEEYQLIKDKIQNFYEKFIDYKNSKFNWRIVFMMDYLKMYIQSMTPEELKSHIIQCVGNRI